MPFMLSLFLTLTSVSASTPRILREHLSRTLSARTANALAAQGLITWGDFRERYLAWGPRLYQRVSGLGPLGVREIREAKRFDAVFVGTRFDPKHGRIADLDLSARTRNALEEWDICTRAELEELYRTEGVAALRRIPNIDRKGARDIVEALERLDADCNEEMEPKTEG